MSTEPKNRFGNIIDASRARHAEQTETEAPPALAENKALTPSARQKRGGKSSDPEYRQLSAYVRRDTHQMAHRKLLDEGGQRDLSDVLEELLSNWVKR